MDGTSGKSGSECSGKNFQATGSQACLGVRDLVSNETSYQWDEFRRAELPSLPIVGSRAGQESIPVKIMQKMAVHLKHACVKSLATLLMHRGILSASERAKYLLPDREWPAGISKQDSLSCLLNDRAKLPVTAEECVRALYLSLRDSYEEGSSVPTNSHYIIASLLLEEAKNCIGASLDTGSKAVDSFSELRAAIERISQSEFQQAKAELLMQNLGIWSLTDQEKFTSYQQICLLWLDIGTKCTIGHLVSALVKSGLGKFASGLHPVYRSNPPRFQNFVMNLSAVGHNWKYLAYFLGYKETDPEVCCVDNCCPLPELKPRMFLRVFRLPNCEQEMESVVSEISSGVIMQRKITESEQNNANQDEEKVTPFKQPNLPCTATHDSGIKQAAQQAYSSAWKKGGKTESDIASNIYLSDGLQLKMHFDQPKVQATSEATEGNPNQHPVSSDTDKSQTISPKKHIYTPGSDQKKEKMPGVSIEQEVPHQTDNKQKQLQTVPGTETPSTSLMKPEPSKPTWETNNQPPLQPQNRSQPRSLPMQLPNYHDRAALLDMCMIGNDWPGVDTIINSMQLLGEELESDEGKTAFHYVCRDGNIGRIKRMIAKGAKVTHIDKSGQSVLHYNAVLTNEQLLKILLIDFRNKRVSVDVTNKESYLTPLMMVCTIGDAAYGSAKLLLEFGANPNGNPKAHSTPLIVACQSTHNTFQLVELLVGHGADINKQDKDGYTLLLKACNSRKWNVAQFILGLPHLTTINRSDRAGTTPLFEAVSQNSYEMVELLLTKGARTSDVRLQQNNVPSLGSRSVEETPFAHACRHGMLPIVKLLVKYKADVNYKCSSSVPALAFAVVNHKNHIVHYLLHECEQLDTSIYGLRTPITYSVKGKNDQCTKWMLDKLGGVQKAAEEAEKIGMIALSQDIEQYRISSQTTSHEQVSTHQSHETVDTGLSSHSDQIEEVLYHFSKICMMVLKSKIKLVDLASVASADNPGVPEIGYFFQRCAGGFQEERSLKVDFLGPHKAVSPLSYVIQQGCLSRQEFMHHAEVYFKGSLGAQEFVGKLVHTFHSISGDTESVSWNGDIVLDRLFSGEFSLSSSQGRIPPPQRSLSWAPQSRATGPPANVEKPRSADVNPRNGEFEWPTRSSYEQTHITNIAQHQASASPPSSSFTPTGHGSTNGLTNGTEPKPGNTSLGSPSIVNKAFPQEPKLCSNPSSLSRPITTAPAYTQASNISPEHHISQSTVRVTSSKEREATPSSLLSYDASVNFGSPHPPVTRESDLTRVSLISAGGSTDVEDTDGIARELYKEPTPNTLREPVTDESELERSIPEPHHFDSRIDSDIDSPHQPPRRAKHNTESYPKDWAGLQCFISSKEILYPKKPESLGFGRYGSVEVVKYKGKECAAKSFRKDFSEDQRASVNKKFTTEFNILSCLRHENIVEYIGATFKPGCDLPLLIMEKLTTNLQKFLERNKNPGLPLCLKLSILQDTVNGLHFLHTRRPSAVIHRDLTATNVLLDLNNRAKIADFGNSCIIDVDVATTVSMTCNPGTPLYSAPEVISNKYGIPIDVFSFGHLALFTISQDEPQSILIAVDTLESGEMKARNEVERRARHFEVVYQYLEPNHRIISMIKECLHNVPRRRPTTLVIMNILADELRFLTS